jgi:hypothetical protein
MDRIFNLYEINKKYSPHLDEVLKSCFTQAHPNLLRKNNVSNVFFFFFKFFLSSAYLLTLSTKVEQDKTR